MTKLGILLPVYNDWLSAGLLIEEIEKTIETAKLEIIFFLVDDGSTNYEGLQDILKKRKKFFKYEIIHLTSNFGHQRAIACGLSYISKEKKCNAVVIMDSDGEDKPVYLKDFLNVFAKNENSIVVAERTKRSESFSFRMFYKIYKILFRVLTGKTISFGNFCLIPKAVLDRIVNQPDLWNNIPSTITRSNFPIKKIESEKRKKVPRKI